MLDLSTYVANLANVTDIQQIIQPERVGLTTIDTSALLTELLEPLVNNRLYAYKLPDNPQYPSAVYEQTGGHREQVDGYIITKTDVFIVAVQSLTLDELITTLDVMRTVLLNYSASNAAGGIEITDEAVVWNSEYQRYEGVLEIEITHLTQNSQATPAYYLYPLIDKAEENQSMNGVSQLIQHQFVGLLVAQVPASGVSGLSSLRNSIHAQIINQIPQPGASRTERVQGSVAGLVGSIVLWRDVYSVITKSHYC